jgi:hypothetical protein
MLQMKRVVAKVPKTFVTGSLQKHADSAGSQPTQSKYFSESVLRCVVDWLGPKGILGSYQLPVHEQVQNISMRSTVENSSSKGGGYGYYQKGNGNIDVLGNFRPFVRIWGSGVDGFCTYKTRMPPTYGQLLSELESRIYQGQGVTPPDRKVIPICEPCKVRVITVHHACESSLWSDFQKEISRKLTRTGLITSGQVHIWNDGKVRDFSQGDLTEMRRTLSTLEKKYGETVIISDDASAATDSIDPDLSAKVGALLFHENSAGLGAFLDTWRGTLQYPADSGIEDVRQRNGQMMGDRRSFPLLCIIHVAAKLAFCKKYGINTFIRVNGDDGIIILPKVLVDHYFLWMSNLWKINQMKTYVSKRFFSYNSQLWDLNKDSQVPMIRFNILDAIDKFGNNSSDPRLWNKVAEDTPESMHGRLWEFFVGNPHWRRTLGVLGKRGNNWFLPEIVGGVGLRLNRTLFDDLVYITPKQRAGILSVGESSVVTTAGSRPIWTDTSEVRSCKTGIKTLAIQKMDGVSGLAPRLIKPLERLATKFRLGRLPSWRAWKNVDADHLEELWKLRLVAGGLFSTENYYDFETRKLEINNPGISIEHCKSCLHNPNEFRQETKTE